MKKIMLSIFALTMGLSGACFSLDYGLNPYASKITTWNKSDRFGNDWFNSSYSLQGDASYAASNGKVYAGYFGSKNRVDATAMKWGFNIAEANAEVAANAFGSAGLANFKAKLKILGTTYVNTNKTVGKDRTSTLWTSADSAGKQKFVLYKKKTKRKDFFFGAWFTIEGGVKGILGLTAKATNTYTSSNRQNRINLNASAIASLTAVASGTVNALVGRGSIFGSLTLLYLNQTAASSLSFNPYSGKVNFNFDLPGFILSMMGKVGVKVEVLAPDICYSWGIPYPCVDWTSVYDKTLISFSGFVKSWNIYSYNREFTLYQ